MKKKADLEKINRITMSYLYVHPKYLLIQPHVVTFLSPLKSEFEFSEIFSFALSMDSPSDLLDAVFGCKCEGAAKGRISTFF